VFGETTEAAPTPAAREQDQRLRGARILLAEDNEINQQIAIELLEGVGAAVTVAGNGREAVELVSRGPQPPPFDVVLMDLQMPEMDGYQATVKLRSDSRSAALPIIAMTAHATIEERQRCLAAGMNDHIAKPIDPSSLFETVGRFYEPATDSAPFKEAQSGAGEAAPALPSIATLDTKDGLSRVGGNQKLYVKLLRQFVDQQGPVVDQITTALATGDMPNATLLAHTLRGVAGNIGATHVQFAAGALEKSLRDGAAAADVEAARGRVAGALDPLMAALKAALGPDAVPSQTESTSTAPGLAESRDAAVRLTALLSECDPGAADFVEANRAALRPLFGGGTWPEFEKLVQGYAFADAQAQLEQALTTLAGSH
jgi:two-component system, sensor histidine kinase and response regulator